MAQELDSLAFRFAAVPALTVIILVPGAQLPTELLLAGACTTCPKPHGRPSTKDFHSLPPISPVTFGSDIKSHTLKSFEKKGYHRAHFEDAWRRYAPPSLSPENAVTAVIPVTNGGEVTPVTSFQGNRGWEPDDLDIPPFLQVANRKVPLDRKPALGPEGDSLDDLK